MITWEALRRRMLCWWRSCDLEGAPVEVQIEDSEPTTVVVCGVHAHVLASRLHRGADVALWTDPAGMPVLVPE